MTGPAPREAAADPWVRAIALAALGFALAVAAYGGIRMPSVWSTMYYMPGYGDGVLRRALPGTLLGPLGLNDSYGELATVGAALLAAALAVALGWLAARRDPVLHGLAALFLLGPFGAYAFHVVGYPDITIWLLLLAALAALRAGAAVATAAVAGAMTLAVLVHEIALAFAAPFALLALWERHGRAPAVLAALWLGALAAGLALAGGAGPEVAASLRARLAAVEGLPLRPDFLAVYETGAAGLLGLPPLRNVAFTLGWGLPFLALLWAAARPADPRRAAALAAAFLAPLGLILFAWDMSRWLWLAALLAVTALLRARAAGLLDARRLALGAAGLLWALPFQLGYFDGWERRALAGPELRAFLTEIGSGAFFAVPAK